jgi:uncharacterized protein
MLSVSAQQAKRIALAAQGFSKRPISKTTPQNLIRMIDKLGVVQIDSVNVLTRAHYLPAFSRLGAYSTNLLDAAAWGQTPKLMEYWAHEASLIPFELQPFLRWRMADARAGVGIWKGVAKFIKEQPQLMKQVHGHIALHGPLPASALKFGNPGARGWWGWSEAKRATECLFWCGDLCSATRNASFERLFTLPETIIPPDILNTPTPSRIEAQSHLLKIALRAMGIAGERDLRDYFRMGLADTKTALNQLIENKDIIPVAVEGWKHVGFMEKQIKSAPEFRNHALLSPFDNLIWHRDRAERLFNIRVKLEIYTPSDQRVHGYYVLPFLEGEAITARVDLKADRKTSTLIVHASHAEACATADTPARLADELELMARWLGLNAIKIIRKGNLATAVARAVAIKNSASR